MVLEQELRSSLPDACQVTVTYPKISIWFEQAEYSIRHLRTTDVEHEYLAVFATFRDTASEYGGTWWQHWYQPCRHAGSDVGLAALIAEEIGRSMARFTDLLGARERYPLSTT